METQRAHLKSKLVAALSIGVFVGLVGGYLWWGRFEYHKALLLSVTYAGAIGVIIFSHLYFKDNLKKLGLRWDNLHVALKVAVLPNLLLLGITLTWGLASGDPTLSWNTSILYYIPWAFLQQYVLQNFLLARSRDLLGRTSWAVITASLLFALIHLPNAPLVVASLIGALVWCRIFLKVPNLLIVSLSHALLGILLVIFFKFNGFDQLQVGRPGYSFRTYGDGVQVAAGYDEAGHPVVVTLPGYDLGHSSLVRVFRPSGELRTEWNAFPDYDFSGNLAVGEIGFSRGDEVVVSPGPGIRNPPEVRIFDLSGSELGRFALGKYPGYGASVSISDGHILVAPGPGPERSARVFEYQPDGVLVRVWDFGDIGFHNGVRVLRLNTDEYEKPKILLWGNSLSVNSSDIRVYDVSTQELTTWKTYGTAFGLNLSPIQLDKGNRGLITGPGSAPGHGPRIKVFDDQGEELQNFFGYEDDTPCGTHVAALDINGDSKDEIVLGEGVCPGQPPIVRIIDRSGQLISKWKAY